MGQGSDDDGLTILGSVYNHFLFSVSKSLIPCIIYLGNDFAISS